MSNLTWSERINAISVNPDMATLDDVANMAATIQEQWQRIAELEAELKAAIELNIEAEYIDKMNELWRDLHRVKKTKGYLESESRGLRDALKLREEENEQAKARIAELEAAQQWHPASEPPEKNGWYLVVVELCGMRSMHIGHFSTDNRYPFFSIGVGADYDLVGWRDLPPLPEGEA